MYIEIPIFFPQAKKKTKKKTKTNFILKYFHTHSNHVVDLLSSFVDHQTNTGLNVYIIHNENI
jgi:hypothetical protein